MLNFGLMVGTVFSKGGRSWQSHFRKSGSASPFDAPDRAEADRRLATAVTKYTDTAPKLADWMESNVTQSLTVFCLPARHRVRMRTSNMLERLNRELKRRTRVVRIFPNDAALLRLASEVLMEVDEGWLGGRKYLTNGHPLSAQETKFPPKQSGILQKD